MSLSGTLADFMLQPILGTEHFKLSQIDGSCPKSTVVDDTVDWGKV